MNLELLEIAASPQFNARVEKLRNQFLSPLLGYDNWRVEQNRWLTNCLRSESETRAAFGQLLNVAEEGIRLIDRKAVWKQLDCWVQDWGKMRKPLVVLGEEGDGKTWAVGAHLQIDLKLYDECILADHFTKLFAASFCTTNAKKE